MHSFGPATVATDAPYMSPANAQMDPPLSASPAMVIWIAQKLAEIKNNLDCLKQVRSNMTEIYMSN